MKIEKVNDHQIRCTLTKADLADRELKISELAYGTEKAKSLFKDMMQQAEEKGVKILLPIDCTIAKDFPNPIDAEIEVEVVDADKIPADKEGVDIGPKTAKLFADAVLSAKTVVWNGPMGVSEWENFSGGTKAVAKAAQDSKVARI